jgi:transcriptional regulator with XRE-family HTH domain
MLSLKNRIGQKIKTLRTEKNLTQEQLAEKAGISIDFLSLIERGRNAPSLESLEKIANALNIEVKDLF